MSFMDVVERIKTLRDNFTQQYFGRRFEPGDLNNLVDFHIQGDEQLTIIEFGNQQVFCASAFKIFVMIEALRQVEAGRVGLNDQLTITDSIKSIGAGLSELPDGTVITLQKAMEVMIQNSDNTGTDMVMAHISTQSVRDLVALCGLQQQVNIPDSTRRFMLQLYGVEPDQPDPGWAAMQKLADGPVRNSPFTISERMAASNDAFTQFYEQVFSGSEYLKNPASHQLAKQILALTGPSKYFTQSLPNVSAAWVKGGDLDAGPYSVVSSAGRMQLDFANTTSFLNFSFILNSNLPITLNPQDPEPNPHNNMRNGFIKLNADALTLVIQYLQEHPKA